MRAGALRIGASLLVLSQSASAGFAGAVLLTGNRARTKRILQAVEANCAGADPGMHASEVHVVAGLLVYDREDGAQCYQRPCQRLQQAMHRLDDPVARCT